MFKVGDRVVHPVFGTGTVCYIVNDDGSIAVNFDKTLNRMFTGFGYVRGHSCNGAATDGHGRFFFPNWWARPDADLKFLTLLEKGKRIRKGYAKFVDEVLVGATR